MVKAPEAALWVLAAFTALFLLASCSPPPQDNADAEDATAPSMTLMQAEQAAALIMATTPAPAVVQYQPMPQYQPTPVPQFYTQQATPMLPAPAYQPPINTTCNTLGDQTSCTSY